MNFLKVKQDLEKYSPQDLDLLSQHYGIKVGSRNDRLWLVAIAILSDKKYAQMIGAPPLQFTLDNNFDEYFEEIKILGKGASGIVVLAKLKQDYGELQRGRLVAVKLIDTATQLENIKWEVDILRNVSSLEEGCNPHIVCYYDSFMTLYAPKQSLLPKKRYFAIVMEYIPGEDLENLIAKKTLFSDTRILQFMKTLAGTLKFLHDRNIVHRDIKTGNIMLDENDVLKYIDFGFSCFTLVAHKYSCKKNVKGTFVSMSPELWKIYLGELARISPDDLYKLYKKADIWALGIVFYELLFGILPPEIEEATELAKAIISKTMSFPTDFQGDPRLVEVTKGMLVRDPKQRSSITQVVNELNKL